MKQQNETKTTQDYKYFVVTIKELTAILKKAKEGSRQLYNGKVKQNNTIVLRFQEETEFKGQLQPIGKTKETIDRMYINLAEKNYNSFVTFYKEEFQQLTGTEEELGVFGVTLLQAKEILTDNNPQDATIINIVYNILVKEFQEEQDNINKYLQAREE